MSMIQPLTACVSLLRRVAILALLHTAWCSLLQAEQPGPTPDETRQYDVVIRGGRIIDGTGNPWYRGDVAVRGDRIVAVGQLGDASAGLEIDANSLVVAPGFIDIHSHSDFVIFEDPRAESKVRQGVTTEVLGEGTSAGPWYGSLSSPKVVVRGTERRWTRLKEYFDLVDEAQIAVNVASFVGEGNVWQSVMGTGFERPDPEQLEQMCGILDEALRDGAAGLSSLLMMPPGSLATTEDLTALCRVVARHGATFSTHIRNEGTGVFESVREAIEIGERSGAAVDIIHLKIADQQYWGRMNEVVGLIEAARERGVNVQANVYPYTRGNNNLVSIIPPWAHEGGQAELLRRLQDPEQRARMKQDILNGIPGWYNHYTAVGGDWTRMLISADNLYQGLTMDRVLALRAGNQPPGDPLDELFDILLEQQGSVSTVYAHHTDEDMIQALIQPWCSVGSDGSALALDGPLRRGNPHPRSFGTFPRVLGVFVREQKSLRLEDAVRKMTSMNATRAGIPDRGLLKPGMFADITIFDPDQVIDRATYSDPFTYCEGIEHVLVNGEVVFSGGKRTLARPGRALRRHTAATPAEKRPN